jgi:hypothetical protein
MGLLNWLGSAVEMKNISYARKHLDAVKRQCLIDTDYRSSILMWLGHDGAELLHEAWQAGRFISKNERRRKLCDISAEVQNAARRMGGGNGSGTLSFSPAFDAMHFVSHCIYLRALETIDIPKVNREAALIVQEYEAFFESVPDPEKQSSAKI